MKTLMLVIALTAISVPAFAQYCPLDRPCVGGNVYQNPNTSNYYRTYRLPGTDTYDTRTPDGSLYRTYPTPGGYTTYPVTRPRNCYGQYCQ